MSFAGDVKTELCRGKLGDKGAAQAEACGVLLYCNRFTLDQVKIVTESPAFAKRLPGLFRKAFGLTFDEKGDPGTPGKRIFTIGDRAKLALLWEVCAFDPSDPAHHINFGLLEDGPCRVAFLRGAFLAGGSVTDPQKGYHLELATTHLRVSRELHTLLLELGYTPKETTRKANYITYFKQSEAIEDFLTAIGAPIAAMELMNAKAEKLLRTRYHVSPERSRLCVEASEATVQAAQLLRPQDVSVYVGIPFCPTRCAYCSFVSSSIERFSGLLEPYLDALVREIAHTGDLLRASGRTVRTLYIGGGTPTTLSAAQLRRLMEALRTHIDLTELVEYTVEGGRPDTLDAEKLETIASMGCGLVTFFREPASG